MAQITINEISKNYTYNIGANSFCTVALPIASCWGPGYVPSTFCVENGKNLDGTLNEKASIIDYDRVDAVTWEKFPATQAGLESFISTYRGPAANYRIAKDFSYYMAVTLLTAGYDVLVCRLCPGSAATGEIKFDTAGSKKLSITAKYPGSFGNNLRVKLNKVTYGNYWNIVTYIRDTSGVEVPAENLIFAIGEDVAEQYGISHIDEVDSKFVILKALGDVKDTDTIEGSNSVTLAKGSDVPEDAKKVPANDALRLAMIRYGMKLDTSEYQGTAYTAMLGSHKDDAPTTRNQTLRYKQWLYNSVLPLYDQLLDKLAYNPNRVICPWDDQDISEIDPNYEPSIDAKFVVSPIHKKLMEVGNGSRCATALLDIPKSLPRSLVHSTTKEGENSEVYKGYAQKLSQAFEGFNTADGSITSSHGALFAPWGHYKYTGTSKQFPAPPSFLYLLIQRAMLLNQPLQYEWALPTNRKHDVNIGKMDYKVPKKYLDRWQDMEGVGVNVITEIPELGTTIWGNSTLYNVPPATYQALANLSTRFLVNAVKDVIYRTGIGITFNYNNDEAYSKFYAGVTPLLDTMKQVGAIEDYYVKMSADINGLDQVNANTVIGKVYLIVNGVINNIDVDLVVLPPGTDLSQFE